MEVVAWVVAAIISVVYAAVRVDRTRSSSGSFADAIEDCATRSGALQRDGRWTVMIDGVVVTMAVVASEQADQIWFAEVQATVPTGLGLELELQHVWRRPRLPVGAAGVRLARSFPALDRAWSAISRRRTPVAIVSDGRRVTAWIDEPLEARDVGQVAIAVAAIARWDAGYAWFLERLPGATPADDGDLSPAVRFAPDGARIGVRGATTVVQVPDGGETVLATIDRDRDRLLAELGALRRRRAASSPYR